MRPTYPCGSGGLAALLLGAVLVIAPTGAQGGGALQGGVTDAAGVPLPGATVTVTVDAFTRRAIAGADGRFRFPDLPPGTYTVRTELAGFDTAVREGILVERGAVTTAAFALSAACIAEAVRVDMGFARTLQSSSVVAHLQIVESRAGEICSALSFCACVEVVTRVHAAMKPASLALATMAFVEGVSATPSLDRHDAGRRYATGQEYVAFLESYSGRGVPVHVPLYMFRVRDGRVEFRRTDAPGLRDGLSVEEFRTALTRFLRGGRADRRGASRRPTDTASSRRFVDVPPSSEAFVNPDPTRGAHQNSLVPLSLRLACRRSSPAEAGPHNGLPRSPHRQSVGSGLPCSAGTQATGDRADIGLGQRSARLSRHEPLPPDRHPCALHRAGCRWPGAEASGHRDNDAGDDREERNHRRGHGGRR